MLLRLKDLKKGMELKGEQTDRTAPVKDTDEEGEECYFHLPTEGARRIEGVLTSFSLSKKRRMVQLTVKTPQGTSETYHLPISS